MGYELRLEQKQKLCYCPTIQNAILLKLIPRLRLTRSGIIADICRVSPKRAKKMVATLNYSSTMARWEWCPSTNTPPPCEKPSTGPWKSVENRSSESSESIRKKVPPFSFRIHRSLQKTSQRWWLTGRIKQICQFHPIAFYFDPRRLRM